MWCCSKSAAIWGTPAVVLTHSERQPVTHRRLSVFLPPEAKIAMAGTLHDRPAPGQFEFVVEARYHGVIAVAVNAVANVRKPELLVEFGELAARHVEVEMVVRLADNLNIHGATARP